MPNWVYGHYAIKGPKENVMAFLNEGIKNSGFEPKQDCRSAYEFLSENAKVKASNFYLSDDEKRCGNTADKPAEIVLADGLSLDTFRPMPDTFKLYDTTNCADKMPDIAKEQQELYGCVGWYDWGVKYRGTKWNADLEEVEFCEGDSDATFKFDATTAWCYPDAWLQWVKQTFHVSVLLCVDEEGDAFCFYGEIDGDEHGMPERDGKPKEEDFESDDDYWDAYYEWESDCKTDMYNEFIDFVNNF